MTGLKNHAQHFSPQCLGFDRLVDPNVAGRSKPLVLGVAILKGFAIQVV